MPKGILFVFVVNLTLSLPASAKDSHPGSSGNGQMRPEARVVGIEYPVNSHVDGAFFALSHAGGKKSVETDEATTRTTYKVGRVECFLTQLLSCKVATPLTLATGKLVELSPEDALNLIAAIDVDAAKVEKIGESAFKLSLDALECTEWEHRGEIPTGYTCIATVPN